MALLPAVYSVTDLPDTGGNTVLIDIGQYPAVILDSGLKPTSKGDGQYLWLKVVITQGKFANTEFTERLNIVNPNNDAMRMAYGTLARISEALGMAQTPQDSSALHNKPLIIDVVTEPGEDWTNKDGKAVKGKDKSIIKKFLPLPKTGTGFGAPAFGATAPVAANAPGAPVNAAAPWAAR